MSLVLLFTSYFQPVLYHYVKCFCQESLEESLSSLEFSMETEELKEKVNPMILFYQCS